METSNSPLLVKVKIRSEYVVEVNQEDGSIRSGFRFRPDSEFELQADCEKEKREERKDEECCERPWVSLRWKEVKSS